MKANLLKETKLRLRLYVVGKIMNYECKVKSTKTTMKHYKPVSRQRFLLTPTITVLTPARAKS